MNNITESSTSSIPPSAQSSEEFSHPDSTQFQDLMKVKEIEEKQKRRRKRPQEVSESKKSAVKSQNPGYKKVLKSEYLKKTQAAPSSPPLSPPLETSSKDQETLEASLIQTVIEEEKIHLSSPLSSTPSLNQIEEQSAPLSDTLQKQASEIFVQKENRKIASATAPAPLPQQNAPFFLTPPSSTPAAYTLLSPEALALFEKMVAVMTVMHTSGITETIIYLNPEEFSSSFLNAQIIIREYSTAPLMYNIELLGNPSAVALFQKHRSLLEESFKEEKRKYKINRLEISLLPASQDKSDSL
ncbi:MAG: hypothetical protein QRY72_04940 [Candidatus Rhabdochlamydia sp.]